MWRARSDRAGGSPVHARTIWAISFPLLLAEIGEVVIHVTDTALLARTGTVQLGAIAIADEVHEIWLALAVGLAQGLQITIARRIGDRRGDTMADFRRGFIIIAVVGAALTVTLLLAAPHVGHVLGGPGGLGAAIGSFLRISAVGIFFDALNLAYAGLIVGTARTRILIAVTAQVALANFVFGYVLIFGHLGLPALGIDGAAWAYVATESMTFLLLTGHIRHQHGPWYRRRAVETPGTPRMRPLLRVSVPVALDIVLDSARWLAFFLIVAQVGQSMLAMSNIIYSVYSVLLLPSDAFRETAVSLVSTLIGRGQGNRVRALMRAIVPRNYMVTLPAAAVTLLFPGAILSIFGSDVTGVAGGETGLRVVALAMLLVAPAEMWLATLEGAAATDVALALGILGTGIVLGWAYVATVTVQGLPYLWLGVPMSAAVTLVLAYLLIRTGRGRMRAV